MNVESVTQYSAIYTESNELEREAHEADGRGWALILLNGKIPITPAWQAGPPTPIETIVQGVRAGRNVGVRTGAASGIVVIDDDTDDQVAEELLKLPSGPTAITGKGRRHHYFRAPAARIKNSASQLAEKVDVRGDGGQVVLPGSIHPETGVAYRWMEGRSPDEVELPDLPDQVIQMMTAAKRQNSRSATRDPGRTGTGDELRRAVERVASAREGQRNETLNLVGFDLGRLVRLGRHDRDDAVEALREAAVDSGLPEAEAARTAARAVDEGHEKRVSYAMTDTDNAKLLVEMFAGKILHCGPRKEWLIWNGARWQPDDRHRLQGMAKEVAQELRWSAGSGDDERPGMSKWAKRSASKAGLANMIDLARDLVAVTPDELDTDPWLLNVLNGTLNLRTGELREHDPNDRITKIAPVPFDPDAPCPTWRAFLDRVLPDESVRDFVQRAVGCSLVGEILDQVLFLCLGGGANGKSTFLNALQAALGPDYVRQAPSDFLVSDRRESHPTELTVLHGPRLLVCSEIGEGKSLDEVRVKRITGGDRMAARGMKENYWEFNPACHLWIATNSLPRVSGRDDAIWRRLIVVPFDVSIPEAERDPSLLGALKEELPGILAWAVEGCRAWRQNGLNPPDTVRHACEMYRHGMDLLGAFLAERTVESAEARTGATVLWHEYSEWGKDRGEDPGSRQAFGQELARRGFRKLKTGGNYVYRGIALIQSDEIEGEWGRFSNWFKIHAG